MNVADQKEIIFTPEAKGMRARASSKGVSVNFSRLKEIREIKPKSSRLAPIGRMENPAGYTKGRSEPAIGLMTLVCRLITTGSI